MPILKMMKMESETACPICNHNQQAQIESRYVQGELSANDIIALIGEEHIDMLSVLIHFSDHPTAIEKEAEKKARDRRLREAEGERGEESSRDYKTMTIPTKKATPSSHRLEVLEDMLEILKQKFNDIVLTKQTGGISQIAKEIRETMREIELVKKQDKATLADRTADLFAEHRSMNQFLLHNLCEKCMIGYEKWLQEANYAG